MFYDLFSTKKSALSETRKTNRLYGLSIKEDDDSIEYGYKNITEAIEATKGYEYYIFEKYNDTSTCKGRWKDYILQK